jgi:signal transduction histidine kinase
MRSMRARIALVAGLSTAVVAIALGLVLGLVLRSSLTTEIEDAVVDQVQSYAASVFFAEDIGVAGISFDAETLAVVVTPEGALLESNDSGVTGAEIVDKLDIAGIASDEIVVGDLSLTSPGELEGERNLRFAMTQLVLENPPGEQPVYLVARSLDDVDSTLTTVRNWMAVAVPLLAAFVAGLAWWLTGRALRPVDRLRQEVDDIEGDDLSRRVTTPGSADEVDRLAETMNTMLTRLDESSTRQRRFASDAAHELRTPLASMAAQLDVDHSHPATADREATAVSMRREVTRLQSIVDDLLALSRDASSTICLPTRSGMRPAG